MKSAAIIGNEEKSSLCDSSRSDGYWDRIIINMKLTTSHSLSTLYNLCLVCLQMHALWTQYYDIIIQYTFIL